MNMFEKLFNLLFPKDFSCIFCGKEISQHNKYQICESCIDKLPYNNQKICLKCGAKITDLSDICNTCARKMPPYKIARAPFVYEGLIRKVVNNFKFFNKKYMFEPLAEYMTETYKKYNFDCEVIICMPLSEQRKKIRGYNQALELAKYVSKAINLPILEDVVIRNRNTNIQSRLNFEERNKNLKNAFTLLNKQAVKGKKILVIDDVMTTGQTVINLCEAILKGKPKEIYVLTLARTYYNEANNKEKNVNNKNYGHKM